MTSVEREQTNKHTNIYTHKHTYRVKTEETFFYGQIFYFLFFFLYLFESKKDGFQKVMPVFQFFRVMRNTPILAINSILHNIM